ncbi:hypothetical protein G9A89_011925 [Geosiphon pyriformis]|nr:hypothetical protein G9A89_011925 [Geosiphon pyriformis]
MNLQRSLNTCWHYIRAANLLPGHHITSRLSKEVFLTPQLVKYMSTSATYRSQVESPNEKISPKVISLYDGISRRDRYYLAKAITLVESTRRDHKQQAQQLLSMILDSQDQAAKLASSANDSDNKEKIPYQSQKKDTFRIGLSGPPGVGKSTFIETFGMHILTKGHRVAVLAVDPSSNRTGGSILGDKTRMPQLSTQENAYIRPSPNRGALAASYDVTLVETVGVGQSEIMVAEMVDMFVLMVPPAGGDELQGLKKGIVENSDLVIVNKADGELANSAREAVTEYTSALKYLHPKSPVWSPKVLRVSAKNNIGIDTAWNKMEKFYKAMKDSGEFEKKRGEQRKLWMWRQITSELLERFKSDTYIRGLVKELEHKVFLGEMTSGAAADYVIDCFTNKHI